MTLFRWSVVAVIAGVAGSGAPSSAAAPSLAKGAKAPNVATVANASKPAEHESEPRVEIGPAFLYLYDETGRVIAVE